MLRLIKLAVVALFSVMLAAPAGARAPEWVELGDHKVELFETDDVIKVGRGDGVFTRIRFDVYGNDIFIRSMRVRFLNGEEQIINIDRKVREGTSSPEFDLPGRRRGIQAIVLRYEGRPLFGGKPRIKVYGLRDDGPFGPPPGPPPPAAGRPTILDTQVVDNASDRIVFNVGRDEGLITQIRLRAVDGGVLYRAIEITFGNGQLQTIEGFDRVEPGEQGKAIDLEGDRRFVQKVVVYKRPSWRPGRTKVELLGLVQPRPAPPPPPSAGGWETIERKVIDRRSETVVFDIARGEGRYSKIKFKALDDSILFRRVEMEYRNGERQTLDVVERLEAGEESPDIDLDGRGLRRVIVTKRPSWRPGESRLELSGLETRRPGPPAPPPGPPPRPAGPPAFQQGWVLIGASDLPASGRVADPGRPPIAPFGNTIPQSGSLGKRKQVIPVGREIGQFKSIGLRLVGDPVDIRSVTILYAGGEPDRVALSTQLRDRSRTQPIQLRGERFIRQIEVEYVKPTVLRSTLEVYGDYADDWLGERGRRRDFNQGWVLLGSQRAQMFASDVDAFHVGRRFGAFRAVRFAVRDHAVRFNGLRIVYGDGSTEDVPFSGELTAGQSTPPLDLKGRRSFIDRIEVRYRTKLNFKGDGVVEVWGMQ